MRTWVKATLGVAAVIAVAMAALGGTAAYFVLRHMETRVGGEAEAVKAIEAVKTRFGERKPLVELVDPRRGDIRINRASEPSAAAVDTVHVINWKGETGELSRTDVPVWLMRFSTVNIASQLGLAPASFRLTVADVERYGPGILVDFASPGSSRTLVWVE
jgi:hypothetical protein